MLIDTHVHYNLSPLMEKWQKYWQQAQAKGLTQSIIAGADLENSQQAIEIAAQNSNLFAMVGVHPDDFDQIKNTKNWEKLQQMAQHSQVVAIGEIGLDYFRVDPQDQNTKDQQKNVFIKQLELAISLNLPICLHVRDKETPQEPTPNNAYWDTLEILEQYLPQLQKNKINFVLHCVSGPISYIKQMIKWGAYFGFDGNLTYKNAHALREIAHTVPKNKIVVETDAPYLPPMPHRGKLCEPWMVTLTAQYLNQEFQISPQQLYTNSLQLFPKVVEYQPEF